MLVSELLASFVSTDFTSPISDLEEGFSDFGLDLETGETLEALLSSSSLMLVSELLAGLDSISSILDLEEDFLDFDLEAGASFILVSDALVSSLLLLVPEELTCLVSSSSLALEEDFSIL